MCLFIYLLYSIVVGKESHSFFSLTTREQGLAIPFWNVAKNAQQTKLSMNENQTGDHMCYTEQPYLPDHFDKKKINKQNTYEIFVLNLRKKKKNDQTLHKINQVSHIKFIEKI